MYASWSDVEKIMRSCISDDLFDAWQAQLRNADTTPGQLWNDMIGPGIQDEIDTFCRRTFATTSEVRSVAGHNKAFDFMGHLPIQSVSEIVIRALATLNFYTFTRFEYANQHDSEGRVVSTAVSSADPQVQVDCSLGELMILPAAMPAEGAGFFWPYLTFLDAGGWWDNIKVTYTYGYVTPPAGVRRAMAALGAGQMMQWAGALENAGVVSWRLGPESRTWASAGGGVPIEFAGFLINGPYASAINPMIARSVQYLKGHRMITVL